MTTTKTPRETLPALLAEAQRLLASLRATAPETTLDRLVRHGEEVVQASNFDVRLGLLDPTAAQPAQLVAFRSLCPDLVLLSDATARWRALQGQLCDAASTLAALGGVRAPTDADVRRAQQQCSRLRCACAVVTAPALAEHEQRVAQWHPRCAALRATRAELRRRDEVYRRVAVEVAAAHAALAETCDDDAAMRSAYRAQHAALFAVLDPRLRRALEQQPAPLAATLYDPTFIPALVPLDGVRTRAAEDAARTELAHKSALDAAKARANDLDERLKDACNTASAREAECRQTREALADAESLVAQLRAELCEQERELVAAQERAHSLEDAADRTPDRLDAEPSSAFKDCFFYDDGLRTAIPYDYIRDAWVLKYNELRQRINVLTEENKTLKSQGRSRRA